MSNLDSLAEAYFRKSKDGKEYFFPWGVSGRGYVVPSLEMKTALKKNFKTAGLLSFILINLILVSGKYFGLLMTLGCFLLYAIVYFAYIRFLTRHLERVDERQDFISYYSHLNEQSSSIHFLLGVICCLGLAIGGIWALF